MKMKEVTIYLKEEVIKDIDNIVFFLNATEKKSTIHTLETFIIGSVINKIEDLSIYNDLADTYSNDRPYKIKNHFKEIADSLALTQKEISNQTGLKLENHNLNER